MTWKPWLMVLCGGLLLVTPLLARADPGSPGGASSSPWDKPEEKQASPQQVQAEYEKGYGYLKAEDYKKAICDLEDKGHARISVTNWFKRRDPTYVGINAVIDLRVVGFAPALRLQAMERFLPVLWLGFWMNAVTGAILLVADAKKLTANLDFYVKMAFIGLALINLRMLRTQVFSRPPGGDAPPPMKAKVLAVSSMIFWLGAITAGRLLAYVGGGGGK